MRIWKDCRVLTSLCAGMVMLLAFALAGSFPPAVQAEVAGLTGERIKVVDINRLEHLYRFHVMRRDRLASELKRLWREERFLKEDYEYSGANGDIATNAEVSRELLEVRQQIDRLRGELSRENKIILSLGDLLPD